MPSMDSVTTEAEILTGRGDRLGNRRGNHGRGGRGHGGGGSRSGRGHGPRGRRDDGAAGGLGRGIGGWLPYSHRVSPAEHKLKVGWQIGGIQMKSVPVTVV